MIVDVDHWWQPFTSIGDIGLYHVDLTPNASREAHAFRWLDGEERSRWVRFQSQPAQRRFVLCRAALRALICQELGCTNEALGFVVAKHGKPFAALNGKPIEVGFNVSHSGQHGLIAVAPEGQLGVDIEERTPRKRLDLLIEGVFSPQEKAELESLEGCRKLFAFFRFWTIKEALIKAHGKGLSLKVSELEIPEDMRHGAMRSKCQFSQFPNRTWSLWDIGTDEFAAAAAYEVEPAL